MPPKEFKFGFDFNPMQEAWNKVYSGKTKVTGSPIIRLSPKIEEAAVPALPIARFIAPYIVSALTAGATTFLPKDLSIEGIGDWLGNAKHDILSAMGYYGFPGAKRTGIPTREEIYAYEHPVNPTDNVMNSKSSRKLRSVFNRKKKNEDKPVEDPNSPRSGQVENTDPNSPRSGQVEGTVQDPNAARTQGASSQNTPQNPKPKKPWYKNKVLKGIGYSQAGALVADGLINAAGAIEYGSDWKGGIPVTKYLSPLGLGWLGLKSAAGVVQNSQDQNTQKEEADTTSVSEWDRQFKLLTDTNKEEADSIK